MHKPGQCKSPSNMPTNRDCYKSGSIQSRHSRDPPLGKSHPKHGALQKISIYYVICLLKIEKHNSYRLMRLSSPLHSLIASKDIVQNTPILDKACMRGVDEVWKKRPKSSTEHACENLIHRGHQSDRSPLTQRRSITPLRYERNQAC